MARSFLEVRYINKTINYDGSQLSPHWIYETTGVMGDTAVSFCGACDVLDAEMADVEDVLAEKTIKAQKMLHFIIELFGRDCLLAASIQSVFMSEIQGELLQRGVPVVKKGDDLFFGKGKLSISVASVSPVSALIHIGLNISNKGTPVKTSSLEDFNIDPKDFSLSILKRLEKEYSRMVLAASKVRPRF